MLESATLRLLLNACGHTYSGLLLRLHLLLPSLILDLGLFHALSGNALVLFHHGLRQ
jgi:hypothetical protein